MGLLVIVVAGCASTGGTLGGLVPLPKTLHTLPLGIRSRIIDNNNGVKMHMLESGFQDRSRPCVVLLHGFPELAYTWRNQLLPLAQAGFHVIAPDLRGYGRSVQTPVIYDDEIPYQRLIKSQA